MMESLEETKNCSSAAGGRAAVDVRLPGAHALAISEPHSPTMVSDLSS